MDLLDQVNILTLLTQPKIQVIYHILDLEHLPMLFGQQGNLAAGKNLVAY